VVTRYAYVLFYRRRNSPVERTPRFHRPMGAESPAGAAASQVRAPHHYERGGGPEKGFGVFTVDVGARFELLSKVKTAPGL